MNSSLLCAALLATSHATQELASEISAKSKFSDLIVQAQERQDSQRHPKRGNKRNAQIQQNATGEETPDAEGTDGHVSDWA